MAKQGVAADKGSVQQCSNSAARELRGGWLLRGARGECPSKIEDCRMQADVFSPPNLEIALQYRARELTNTPETATSANTQE